MQKKNKYFYRGIVRILLSLVVIIAGIFVAYDFKIMNPQSQMIYFVYIVIAFGVLAFSRGLYYLIPFSYGSPWNGEMRWKATVFEYTMGFTIILALSQVLTPLPSTINYVWLVVTPLFVIGLFWSFGKLGAKRAHAPINEDFIDKFLAKNNIY